MFLKTILFCWMLQWVACVPVPNNICALPSCTCEEKRVTCRCILEDPLLIIGTTTPPTITMFELSNCERATLPIGVLGRNITTVKISKIGSLEIQKEAFYNPLKFSLTLENVNLSEVYSFDNMNAENVLIKGVHFGNLSQDTFNKSDIARMHITNCNIDIISQDAVSARVGQLMVDNTTIGTIKEEAFSLTSFEKFQLWNLSVGMCEKKAFAFHHSQNKTECAISFQDNNFDIIQSDFVHVLPCYHPTTSILDKFEFIDNTVRYLDEDAFKHVNKDHFRSVTLTGNTFKVADRQGADVGGLENSDLGNNTFNCEIQLCYLLINHKNSKLQPNHSSIYSQSTCNRVGGVIPLNMTDLGHLYGQYKTPYECIDGIQQNLRKRVETLFENWFSMIMTERQEKLARGLETMNNMCIFKSDTQECKNRLFQLNSMATYALLFNPDINE